MTPDLTEDGFRPIEGGCACRGVRYRLAALPMFVHCCHCRWCQRETGSAFVINALVEADQVEILTGQPEIIDTPTESGRGQKVHRCPACKVALWSNYTGAGDSIHFLRVGTLDDPDRIPPDIHIFTASKQPWVIIPEGVPAVPEYYRLKDHWPAASLERREATKS